MSQSNFDTIFSEYYSKVIRICKGYVHGDEAKAKDLAQEVFIKIWQNLDGFRQDSKLSTWIYRITVNICLMSLRSSKVNRKFYDFQNTSSNHGVEEMELKELQFQKMYGCIDRLNHENKAIILLELEGHPQQDIAEILGMSHEAIRVRIHRIKNQLTTCVNNENI